MKQDNRGGARKGAGRKAIVYSDEFKRNLHSALEQKHKSSGESVYNMIVDLAYDKRISVRERVQLLKIIAGTMTVKETHQTVTGEIQHRPVVALPPIQAHPARISGDSGTVIDGETGEVMAAEKDGAAEQEQV